MQVLLKDDLPFVPITISFKGKQIDIPMILIDTGSATTILAADQVSDIRIVPEPEDTLYTIRGVGGTEVVFTRTVDFLQVGNQKATNFQVEIDGMDYGFDIQGILGMDFLIQAGALLDLHRLDLDFHS